MQLLLLHLDDALELQPDFVDCCVSAGAREFNDKAIGREVRLWGRQSSLDALWRDIAIAHPHSRRKPRLCLMGSGDFHHVSALLLGLALEQQSKPVTVIHLDNHPDWVRFEGGIHCGSWVNSALANPLVAKVITVGVCSSDLRSPERKGANLLPLANGRLELYPFAHPPSRVRAVYGSGPSFEQLCGSLHWKSIVEFGEANFLDRLLARIKTEAVYVTIDKDVLSAADAVTNWDQGSMRLPYVLWLISNIAERHRIIGADVTGDYSAPKYGGGLWARAIKRAEALIDQPLQRSNLQSSRNINSSANLALMEVLEEGMQ